MQGCGLALEIGSTSERTALLQEFCLSLLKGARVWRHIADAEVDGFEISEATAYPLMFITRLGDGLRQSALAEAIGIEGPSLVRLLDQLCTAGFVQRREDPSDKRAKTLHVTPSGTRLSAAIARKLDQARARVFATVTDDDIRTVLHVFAALDRAAEPDVIPEEVTR